MDIGCGNGKSVSTLRDMGYRVTGMDFSEEAVDICIGMFGDSARIVHGDALSLPFPDGSFDYITAVHIMEHLDDRMMHAASSEILRVLRPDGFLFIRSFTPDDMRSESRSGNGIRYVHRYPEDILGFFPSMDVLSSEKVDERTRFGTVRSRSECLLRKPGRTPEKD